VGGGGAQGLLRQQVIEQLTQGGAFTPGAAARPPPPGADPVVVRLVLDYLRASALPFAAAILQSEAGAEVRGPGFADVGGIKERNVSDAAAPSVTRVRRSSWMWTRRDGGWHPS
jgi:hypothetical protein